MKSDAPNNLISGLKIVPGHILRGVIWALQAILNPKIGSFLWPSTPPLCIVLTPPEGPRAHVLCQGSRGIGAGARDVRRAPYYCVVGYSGICAGGQVQSQFP